MSFEERIRQLELRVAELEQKQCVRRPKDHDIAVLRTLLPAIRGRIGSDPFKTSELRLRVPIMSELTNMSVHQLGMLFSRCAGIEIDGLHIQRTKATGGSLLWCLGLSPPSPLPTIAVSQLHLR